MKKITNNRSIVFCFVATIFSVVSIVLSRFGFYYLCLLFGGIICSIILCIFDKRRLKYIYIPIFLLIGFISITFTGYTISEGYVDYDGASIKGRVSEVRKYGYVIDNVEVAGNNLHGKVLVKTTAEFAVGDVIYSYGDIDKIVFDCDDSFVVGLYDDEIYHITLADFVLLDTNKLSIADKIKRRTNELFTRYMREDSKDIAYGMLFGDVSNMDYDLKDSLSATGLNHIFAVSGLHIGFLTGIIMWINRKLHIKGWLNIILTSIVLLLYNLLCGYSPSMVRATIMAVALFFGKELGYKNDGLSKLCFAGLLIAIFKPLSVFTISFQLSFMALFGIVAFSGFIIKKLNKIPKWSSDLIGLSLAVNFAIFPFICYYFNRFAVLFLPVNFVIMPIIPLIYASLIVLTIANLIFPNVAFLVVMDYLFVPIKLASLVVGEVSFAILNIIFSRLGLLSYFTGEIVISKYIFIKKRTKICIFLSLILLSLIFVIAGVMA